MPVANGLTRRSWIWGPEPITGGFRERNSDSPGGLRMVQYFDKSRMEVNDPNATPGPWYVTNGLLVEEMIVGAVQVGTQSFEPCAPSEEAVAGDPAAENANAPTYRSFRDWSFPLNQDRAPDRRGQAVTAILSKDGHVSDNPELARYATTISYYEPQLGHNVPQGVHRLLRPARRDFRESTFHDRTNYSGLGLRGRPAAQRAVLDAGAGWRRRARCVGAGV